MTTYAVAHMRKVTIGPPIVEYLHRILPLRMNNSESEVILVDGVTEGHRATDVLAGGGGIPP
jgi:hypothetical protein